ncbi:hypothetical protein H5410_039105 [Solanum commersonii]|uniref:Uncharacterized protein n=1 Tax=Solanum commersonii TaxID=4109 RepID=A0A9J5YC32_SOLCO|nr:hypothetical protein H5410_039105 [Solanum commersonii]
MHLFSVETCRGHSIEVCLVGGGYWVTVMIHLDDSQVKYKTENDDFDHNHSPGDQTHLSMTVTGPRGALFWKFNQKGWVIIHDTAPLIELSRVHTALLKWNARVV